MKSLIQYVKTAAILGGLLIMLPMAGQADKGGNPNVKSKALVINACVVPPGVNSDGDLVPAIAEVCSCKALSNVVLQCGGGVYVKHDDIGLDSDGNENEMYNGEFACVDSEGNIVPGEITMVAVKSGSQKNAKHHPDDYATVADAPPGSGLLFLPSACPEGGLDLDACPAPGDCTGGTNDEEPPPPLN